MLVTVLLLCLIGACLAIAALTAPAGQRVSAARDVLHDGAALGIATAGLIACCVLVTLTATLISAA